MDSSSAAQTPHDAEWLEYDDDTRPAPAKKQIETGGVLPNGKAGVILKHAADTK